MISLIQAQVVYEHHWMTSAEFTNIIAISQITPGPIGINSATYCGYTAVYNLTGDTFLGMLGSCTATFALMLPMLCADDCHKQTVHEIYEHKPCAEHFPRTSPSRCRTSCSRYPTPCQQGEFLYAR